jgi:hypothetical protein
LSSPPGVEVTGTNAIRIVLNIDPSKTTPDEAAQWVIAWAEKVTKATTLGASKTIAGPSYGLDTHLGRLAGVKAVFASHVRRVHESLVQLGYTPTLPTSGKEDLPRYISYVDPTTV